MTKKTANITPLIKPLDKLLRFHYIIFIILVIGMVAYTVYKVNSILNLPTDQEFKSQQEKELLNDGFDTETIKKLKQFNYSSNPQPTTLPPGRNSPFSE